ncbi:hypothetical protein N866_01775 [Actinotalea ferrariae CF5-4]|uniref:Uncharacterized protein n=1 Tax=Actinotalea ferrariae CF5-4 TaxID=948458 RepID=A0A021VQ80_9CELL|nr:hypothetical protein [Actinotalea ferrariae]EYR63268.1 hypothetical protein N866_01775 [Actinotalea ferrariae CF5-4]
MTPGTLESGLAKAVQARKLAGVWANATLPLFPDRYAERAEWLRAFREYGYTVNDTPAGRPAPASCLLFRGSPEDTRDGLSWTPVPAAAAVSAFAPWHVSIRRRAGRLWVARVHSDAILAVITHTAPVIGDWIEAVVDTADLAIEPVAEDLDETCRTFVRDYLRGPVRASAARAFGLEPGGSFALTER